MVGSTRLIVGAIVFLLIGVPLMIVAFVQLYVGTTMFGIFGLMGDFGRLRIERNLNADDIAFGGDAKQLRATYERLRKLTASVADGRISNRSLSVAVVDVTNDRVRAEGLARFTFGHSAKSRRTQPIEVDVGQAGEGAVLLLANRPVRWSAADVQPGQRAKIAIEGSAVFDVAEMPKGLLAGFRIGAFGAFDPADANDAAPRSSLKRRKRFCRSVVTWARHFQVEAGDIRLWRMTDPDRITLMGDRLSQSGGTQSKPEFLTDFCR